MPVLLSMLYEFDQVDPSLDPVRCTATAEWSSTPDVDPYVYEVLEAPKKAAHAFKCHMS